MMSKEELLARISVDPATCFGKPYIRGHRIRVSLILNPLAAGWSHREVLDNDPAIGKRTSSRASPMAPG